MILEDPSIGDITTEDLCGDYPADRFDTDVLAERFGFRCAARLEGQAFSTFGR